MHIMVNNSHVSEKHFARVTALLEGQTAVVGGEFDEKTRFVAPTLLDFYGEVLTEKQREMLRQYYNDDLSLSEIGENFGITRQGARDAIKHGESALKELEEKVGFAARYRRVQQKLEELEQMVISPSRRPSLRWASMNSPSLPTPYFRSVSRSAGST